MLAPEFAGTQEGTIHFHHLLPENGGFLRIAATLDEHVAQLADRLRHPESSRAETARFVSSFIRPHGVDRPATPLFADAIERLASSPARCRARRRYGRRCCGRWRWRWLFRWRSSTVSVAARRATGSVAAPMARGGVHGRTSRARAGSRAAA